jgi:hypothetical protein
MLDADQIDAFREDTADAIDAAMTYRKRAKKGLPADRWADGATGARLVAQGIHALECIIAMQTAALEDMLEEATARGVDAMRLHKEDNTR